MATKGVKERGGDSGIRSAVRTAGDRVERGASAMRRNGAQRRPGSGSSRTAHVTSVRSARGETSFARLLAPVALVICAIAVFSVLTTAGGDQTPAESAREAQSAENGRDSGDRSSGSGDRGESAAGGSDTGSTTEPVKATYKVKPGDSFAAIAEDVGVPVERLAELNPDVDPRALQPGQKLKLK